MLPRPAGSAARGAAARARALAARAPGAAARRAAQAPTAAAGLLLAALVAAAPAPGCWRGGGEQGPPGGGPEEAVVELVTLRPELLRNVVSIPGQLASENSVEVRAEIEGILESIEFREGDFATRGQVLFLLRDDEQRALLAEAEAARKLAAAVSARTARLAERDVSSEAQLEKAEAELAVAEAKVEVARVELERTRIRAPFDGVLGARRVAPGDRVRRQTVLVGIDAVDRLQLLFYLPEQAVGVVQPGIPVRIRVAPFPDERFDGEVFFVSPTLEPEGRRFLVKAWVPNPDRRLRPGLFAEIEAEIARRDGSLLVPDSALVYDLDGTYVWRVGADGRAERAHVEVGLRQPGRAEIARGLAAGDVIVAAGVHKVKPGGRVRAAGAEGARPVAVDAAEEKARGGPS